MSKFFLVVKKIKIFLIAKPISLFMYRGEYYLGGHLFQHWYSQGWEWVVPDFWGRVLLGKNRGIPWPTSPFSSIGRNIEFDVEDINNFWGYGNYFQTWDAKIKIGKGTFIAPNCGLITSNHDIDNLEKRGKIGNIELGDSCWIGMNSVILPGVVLGSHTIVGAGSVVTHSFPKGNCIIAGNPARIIREL